MAYIPVSGKALAAKAGCGIVIEAPMTKAAVSPAPPAFFRKLLPTACFDDRKINFSSGGQILAKIFLGFGFCVFSLGYKIWYRGLSEWVLHQGESRDRIRLKYLLLPLFQRCLCPSGQARVSRWMKQSTVLLGGPDKLSAQRAAQQAV